MDRPATADAIVIGGGINGGAVAWNLARLGLTNLVVLEAQAIAYGASSRGAGIIRTHYKDPDETKLAILSLDIFRNWKDEIGGDCGYEPSGFLWLVGPQDKSELEATVDANRHLGAASEVLSAEDVARLQPHSRKTAATATPQLQRRRCMRQLQGSARSFTKASP
jgi:sarcosine oxidase subunit beta